MEEHDRIPIDHRAGVIAAMGIVAEPRGGVRVG